MIFDATIKNILNEKLAELEKNFGADAVFYYGEIHPSLIRPFRDLIEDLIKGTTKEKHCDRRLVGILHTGGGFPQIVGKMVDIARFHYGEVYFVVPDFAMSAGTFFVCRAIRFTWIIRPLSAQLIRRCGTAHSMSRPSVTWTRLKSCSKRQKLEILQTRNF